MARKKICPRCGKIVDDTKPCTCVPPKREISEKQKESDKLLRTTRWRKLRERVLKRDNYMCQRCWYKYNIITNTTLQVHHIKSRDKYATLIFQENNCICLCQCCNLQLGTSDELDFEINKEDIRDEDFIL